MGKWLELFRTLTNSGIDALTDSDTSRHTDAHAPKNSGIDGLTDSDTSRHTDPYDNDRPPLLDILTHAPVCHDVSLSVRPSIPLKNTFAVPSTNRNGSHFPASPSSIEAPDAAAYDAALTVFCDFETRNTGGCDLKTAGAWRYAADSATEILCFGYRVGGVDHSWAPTMSSRDPLERLAADPELAFVWFGGFEQTIWQKIMVAARVFADPDPAMGRPARDGELLRLAPVARQGARGAGAADRKGQGRPAPRQEPVQA